MPVLERFMERRLSDGLDRRGITHLKLNVQGRRGWPDRLVLLHGRVLFVELKTPGGRLNPRQKYVHAKLDSLGFEVLTVTSVSDVLAYIDQINV